MRLRCRWLFFFSILACATPEVAAPPDPARAFSYGSSASSNEIRPPAVSPPISGLIVRPDVATFPIVLLTTAADCQQALAILEKYAADLSTRLDTETHGEAKLHLHNLDLAELRGARTLGVERSRVEGVIEVSLGDDSDYWTRMKLLVQVAQIVGNGNAGDDARELQWALGSAVLRVSDVERYRSRLTESWVRHMRDFGERAQSSGSPLVIEQCDSPGEITQTSINAEEVALQLAATCHLKASAVSK